MSRAQQTTQSAAADIQKSAGVAERSVNSFSKSAGSSSNFRPYAMLAASRGFENAADRANLLRGSLISLTAVAGGFGTALTTNIILRYADTFTKLNNQIRVVSDSSADAASRFDIISDTANRSRSSLEATALLYNRIQKAAPDKSGVEVLGYVETIQKALALGGATTQEARSAAIQFSQAIASNRLSGDEMRAILETPLGLELAKGLGVTIGKFREMGQAGELTADIVLGALAKIRGSINEQFGRSVLTVDQALTFVDNKLIEYIGNINKSYGATRLLSGAIVGIGNNLDSIIPTIGAVAGLFAAGFIGRIAGNAGKNVFGGIAFDAAHARAQVHRLLEEQEKLRSSLTRADIRVGELKAAPVAPLADKSAVAEHLRATQALTKLDEQYLGVLDKRRQMIQELAAITAQMSPRAAKLADAVVAAESRVNDALARQNQVRKELVGAKTAEIGALGLGAATGRTTAANEATRARIALEKQAVQAEGDVLRQREGFAAKQDQLNTLTSASEQKAAQQRIAVLKQIQTIDQATRFLDTDRQMQQLQAQFASRMVDLSGDKNAQRRVAEATAEADGIRTAVAGVQAKLVGATAAASHFGLAGAFVARQWSSLVGLFGGPWGVAITAGIIGFGLLSAAAAKSAQETKEAGQIYDEAIAKRLRAPSGPVDREAIIAQSSSLQKIITQSEERKKAFQEEIAGLQKWAQEFKLLQKATDPVDQLNRVLEVTGGNFENIIAEMLLLRGRGEDITPIVEQLEAAARGALGMEERVKAANDELNRLGKSRTGPSEDIPDMAAFHKTHDEYLRGTRDLAEVAKIAARGDSVAAAARKEYLEQLGKEGAVTHDIILARHQQVDINKMVADSYKSMKDAAVEAGIAEQTAAEKAIADQVKYLTDARNKIFSTLLKAKGKDVEARAIEIRIAQPGIKEPEATKLAKDEDAADKLKEAYDKAKREKENLAELLKRMKEEAEGAFFGDVDREVLKFARTKKASAEAIAAYVAAIKSGDLTKAPDDLIERRRIELTKKAGEAARETVKQYGDWTQIAPLAKEKQDELNIAVAKGAITAAQAKLAMADFLSGFQNYAWINKTAEAFGTFAEEVLMDFNNIGKAFENLLKSIQRLIIQEFVATPLKNAIKSILGSVASSGSGFNLSSLASLFSSSSVTPAVMHAGGDVGSPGPTRRVAASVFRGAPRYHSGLRAGEHRAILMQGERVLTRNMAHRTDRALAGLSGMAARTPVGGGAQVNNIVHNYGRDQVEQRTSDDGLTTETIIRPIENMMADRRSRGHGAIAKTDTRRLYG